MSNCISTYEQAMNYEPSKEEMKTPLTPTERRQGVELVTDLTYDMIMNKVEDINDFVSVKKVFNQIFSDTFEETMIDTLDDMYDAVAQENPDAAISLANKYEKILVLLSNPAFIKAVKLEFAKRDFELTITQNEEVDSNDVESWQVDVNGINQYSKLSQQLKVQLATLTQMKFEGTKLVPKLGFLNNQMRYPIGVVYSTLIDKLGNSQDPSVFDLRVKENMDNPIIAQLFDPSKTDQELADMNAQIYRHIGQMQNWEYIDYAHYKKIEYDKEGRSYTVTKSVNFNPSDNNRTLQARRQISTYVQLMGKLNNRNDYQKLKKDLDTDNYQSILTVLKNYGIVPDNVESDYSKGITDIKNQLLEDIDKKNGDPLGLEGTEVGSSLDKIIDFTARNSPVSISLSHRNQDGKQVYEVNKPNFLSRLSNTLYHHETIPEVAARYEALLNDPYISRLPLFQQMMNKITRPIPVVLNSTRQVGQRKGTEYKSMSMKELALQQLSAFLLASPNKAVIANAVHSDASIQTGMRVLIRTLDGKKVSRTDGYLNKDEMMDHLESLALLEREMVQNRDELQEPNSHIIFPFLKDKNVSEFRQLIDDNVQMGFEDYFYQMEDLGIVERVDVKDQNGNITQAGKVVFANDMFNKKGPATDALYDTYTHHLLYNAQLALIMNGDPSYYGTIDYSQDVSKKNNGVGTYFKRTKQIWSPLNYLKVGASYTNKNGETFTLGEKFNTVVLKEVKTYSPKFIEWIEKHYPEYMAYNEDGSINYKDSKFGNISMTDAQSYIDPIRYKQQMIGSAEWNDKWEESLDNLLSGEFNNPDAELYGPQKPFYFNFRQVNGRAVPFQNKDSEFILLPVFGLEIINGKLNPLFNPMYKWMLQQMGYTFTDTSFKAPNQQDRFVGHKDGKPLIDKFTFDSAVKVGNTRSYDTDSIIQMDNDGFMPDSFDQQLNNKLQTKLKELYPEIKLNITNTPNWEQGSNVFNQEQYDNQVNYRLKAVDILTGAKAKRIFAKGEKVGWDLNKILTELQVPKDQKQIILSMFTDPKEELVKSIFPKSKYTKIVYHGGTVINKFSKDKIGYSNMNSNKNDFGQPKAFYFTTSEESSKTYGNVVAVALDIRNPEIINQEYTKFGSRKNNFRTIQKSDLTNKDSFIIEDIYDARYMDSNSPEKNKLRHGDTIGVFDPDQIHILTNQELSQINNSSNIDTYIDELSLQDNIVINLLSDVSYGIEVNEGKRSDSDLYNSDYYINTIVHDNGDTWYDVIETNTQVKLNSFGSLQNAKDFITNNTSSPSSDYYANLTVPGGTNYRENEIATPKIIPNIKGHAQFSTENGIGWFRSDEQQNNNQTNGNQKEDIEQDYKDGLISFSEKEELISKLGRNTNTRRILEVQSDLFQKGKASKDLIEKKSYAKVNNEYYIQEVFDNLFVVMDYQTNENVGEYSIREEAEERMVRLGQTVEKAKKPTNKEINSNKFLQLLNQKGNWINFFLQSIVQDSLKKGYSRVLFPTGQTAAKVEGHTLISDKIKQLENTKAMLESMSIGTSQNKFFIKYSPTYIETNIYKLFDTVEKAQEQLEKEKTKRLPEIITEIQKYKTEGLEKLAPIEGFYENRVSNILNKLYDVNQITDEYGNTWNEVILAQPKVQQEILLQKNEAGKIVGQANIDAMTVLIDAANQKNDTLPHEYAHHYIAMFRDSDIVQEGIKRFGSEEALVQAIGEQVVKQRGEALNWWKKFVEYIFDLLSDKQVLQILTDGFLQRTDLNQIGSKKKLEGQTTQYEVVKMDNSAYGKQGEVPNHILDDEQKMAVQVRKNIIKDIDPNKEYKAPHWFKGDVITGQELVEELNKFEIDNLRQDMESIGMRFNDTNKSYKENMQSVVKLLREAILERNMDTRFIELTQLDSNGDTQLSLDHPAFIYQIRQVLNAVYSKKVIQQKLTNGVAYANASPRGFTELPQVKTKDDGTIEYYEAYAPVHNSVLKEFINPREILDYKEMKKRVQDSTKMSDEEFDRLVSGIIWRIPNEKVFSNFHIKITKFFPSEMGGSIMLPLEMTAISGAD